MLRFWTSSNSSHHHYRAMCSFLQTFRYWNMSSRNYHISWHWNRHFTLLHHIKELYYLLSALGVLWGKAEFAATLVSNSDQICILHKHFHCSRFSPSWLNEAAALCRVELRHAVHFRLKCTSQQRDTHTHSHVDEQRVPFLYSRGQNSQIKLQTTCFAYCTKYTLLTASILWPRALLRNKYP